MNVVYIKGGMMVPYSETELVAELRKQNPNAFNYLVQEYTKPVYFLAYNILNIGNSKEDIEECVSDVFVQAWQCIQTYDHQKGNLRSWLLMLTKYKALSYKRRLGKYPVEYLEDFAEIHPEPVGKCSPVLDREAQLLLLQVINSFGELDRQLFIRRYLFNESTAALALSVGTSQAAINNRLFRSKKRIREALLDG